MRIDVDLCGHLLVMRRREELLRGMISCAAVSDGSFGCLFIL
jgi:hypothetical protein